MKDTHHRNDISDKDWELLETHLQGRKGTRGVTALDNRNFLNAVFGDSANRCAVARFAP